MSTRKDKKRNIETSAEVVMINEQTPETGKVLEATEHRISCVNVLPDKREAEKDILEGETSSDEIETPTTVVGCYNESVSLGHLREVYKNSGNSLDATYDYLKNEINSCKDDPEALKNAVTQLLNDAHAYYDHNKEYLQVGKDSKEVLGKLLTNTEEKTIDGLICTTIHEYAMKALKDCGIDSVIVSGTSLEGPHATLLYQNTDGKYVWNNYGESIVIDADNIKDAIKTVYKHSGKLVSIGYLSVCTDKEAYKEFVYAREVAFGEQMDKRDYNSLTPADMEKITEKSSVKGRVELSTMGSQKVGVDATYAHTTRKDNQIELGVSLESKKNNETELLLSSKSTGLKTDFKMVKGDEDKSSWISVKGIVSKLDGTTDSVKYGASEAYAKNFANSLYNTLISMGKTEENAKTATKVMYESLLEGSSRTTFPIDGHCLFLKFDAGKKNQIFDNGDTKISNLTNFSLMGGLSLQGLEPTDGDVRILVEDGVNIKNSIGKVDFDSTINAGIAADIRQTVGNQIPLPSPTAKLSLNSTASYSPNENLAVEASVRAYNVKAKVATETGIGAGVKAVYKPDNSKIKLFGLAKADYENQRLKLGGFNQNTENKVKVNTVFGAEVTPKTTVSLGYSKLNDRINSTRNYDMFNVGVKFNF